MESLWKPPRRLYGLRKHTGMDLFTGDSRASWWEEALPGSGDPTVLAEGDRQLGSRG
jgi:hypothetical protein